MSPRLSLCAEQLGEERGVVKDDAVGDQSAALRPEVLLVFGPKAQLSIVGIEDRAPQLVIVAINGRRIERAVELRLFFTGRKRAPSPSARKMFVRSCFWVYWKVLYWLSLPRASWFLHRFFIVSAAFSQLRFQPSTT